MARDGILEPLHDWIKQVDKDYAAAWSWTVWALQSYLNDQHIEGALCVDSDWLIVWLASNALLSERLGKYYGLIPSDNGERSEIVSRTAKMRYLMYLSQHVLYALHCVRHDRRKKVFEKSRRETHFRRPPFADIPAGLTSGLSEAQLYVLSEYAYREIGIHRELQIFERLIRQLYYELPLYAASNFYRDHLYHVMDVCLLGELLLRSLLTENDGAAQSTLVESFARQTENCSSDELLQNWYVAALCHDLGYVVENADKLLEPVSAINGDGLDDFVKQTQGGLDRGKRAIRRVLEKGEHHESSEALGISVENLKKLLDDADPTDHGVVAWLHLLKWLKDVKGSVASLAPALIAILRHNLHGQKVNIREEPLTMLLMLCDHLQEWGRPRVGPSPLAQRIMEGLRFSESPELERKVRAHRLLIRGLQPAENTSVLRQVCEGCTLNGADCTDHCFRVRMQMEKSRLEFILPHIESREGDFEPGISWLLFCRDLQCLGPRSEALPVDITIKLKHAPPRIWSALPWQPLEMEILEEFANTYEKATYLCEWIEFARRGEEGIEYNRKAGEETFTIKLHELGRPLSRGLPDEVWKDFFKWKWRWLGQKFITLSLGTWFPEL